MMFNPLEFLSPRRGYDTRFDRDQVGTGGNTLGQDLANYQASNGKAVPQYGGNYNPIQDGDTFRMPAPQWAPGEFEEWKTAKMTGMPTQYGWNKQREYNQRKNRTQQPFSANPALEALIKRGFGFK